MSKNAFNDGVKTGLKISEKVLGQENKAMDYRREKIDLVLDGHDEMKNAINKLIEDKDETAINNIFGVFNKHKPTDLKDHEKKILLNVLATLSILGQNKMQKDYLNNLRHHLNLQGYDVDSNYDFRKLESIESVQSFKTMAKAIRIFLYLQDLNMDGIYRHEDDLFSYFVLRDPDFNSIDATIELASFLFGEDALIEMYGYFDESEEIKQANLKFLNIEEAKKIDISYECAQVYFDGCYHYDSDKQYIESSSYILFAEKDNIVKVHKKTADKSILLTNIENPSELIINRKIATFSDMGYYVQKNDLYYIDLNTLETGLIFHIDEEKDKDDNTCDVEQLLVYKAKKLLYKNGANFIVDFKDGKDSIKKIAVGLGGKYKLKGDYIYYVDDYIYDDMDYSGYIVKKYGILNGHTTEVSKAFGKYNDESKSSFLQSAGMFEKYYYCIFSYFGDYSSEPLTIDCFYINTENEQSEAHKFYIWQSRIYQIDHFDEYLIYVNADKNYSLTSHNFIKDEKKVLKKNYGKDEETEGFGEWLMKLAEKSSYQIPQKYMRVGKWLWIENGLNSEIVSVCH